jgi:hypothetical protein
MIYLSILNYYEKQLDKDEIFMQNLYKYTSSVMIEEAKLRDIDDSFFEYIKEHLIELDASNSARIKNRRILKTFLKSYIVGIYNSGEIRERHVILL